MKIIVTHRIVNQIKVLGLEYVMTTNEEISSLYIMITYLLLLNLHLCFFLLLESFR